MTSVLNQTPYSDAANAGEQLAFIHKTQLFQSSDGLHLGARFWEPKKEPPIASPILCLPGLTRNSLDFNAMGEFFAVRGHRVCALDYRGRGLSDFDADWRNYNLSVESRDIFHVIDQLGWDSFSIVGSSRGGLHAMLLANIAPQRVNAVILNDVGPKLESKGISRIAASVGVSMEADSWETASARLKERNRAQFPNLDDDDWLRFTRQLYRTDGDKLRLNYDPALRNTLQDIQPSVPLPELWEVFDNINAIPLMTIRGENSDVLTVAILNQMTSRRPGMTALTAQGQGHTPMLWEREILEKILSFCEGSSVKIS